VQKNFCVLSSFGVGGWSAGRAGLVFFFVVFGVWISWWGGGVCELGVGACGGFCGRVFSLFGVGAGGGGWSFRGGVGGVGGGCFLWSVCVWLVFFRLGVGFVVVGWWWGVGLFFVVVLGFWGWLVGWLCRRGVFPQLTSLLSVCL